MNAIARGNDCEWLLYDYDPITRVYKSYSVLSHYLDRYHEHIFEKKDSVSGVSIEHEIILICPTP